MPRLDLRLENLSELDGGSAGVICNAAITAAVNDLEDRGNALDRVAKKIKEDSVCTTPVYFGKP